MSTFHVFQKINRSGDSKPQTSNSFLPTASASPFFQPETRFQDYSSRVTNSRSFKDVALLIAANHTASNLRFNSPIDLPDSPPLQVYNTAPANRPSQISQTSLMGLIESKTSRALNSNLDKILSLQQIASRNLQHLKLPIPPSQSKTSLDFGISPDQVSEIADCWRGASIEEWLEAAMNDKGRALQLQHYLAVCSEDEIQRCIAMVQGKCCQLLTHHLGCYILVQLITRSDAFARLITSVIFNHFDALLKNENASRAMQALAKHHEPFRREVLKSFHYQSRYYISSISAVFLFCSLIQTCKSQKEYTLIRETLFRDLDLLVMSRFYKKALVTFSENCTDEDLDLVLKLITRDGKDVPSALEDKYLTHVFRVCIIRGNTRSRQQFTKFISSSSRIFEARKCLKMMLFRLSETLPEFGSSNDTRQAQIAKDLASACRTAVLKHGNMITNNDVEVFSTRYEVWNLLALIGLGSDMGVDPTTESHPNRAFLGCVDRVLHVPQH